MKTSQNILIQSLKATLGRMNPAEVEINKSFVRGKWAEINRMIRMNPEEHRELLGRARIAN